MPLAHLHPTGARSRPVLVRSPEGLRAAMARQAALAEVGPWPDPARTSLRTPGPDGRCPQCPDRDRPAGLWVGLVGALGEVEVPVRWGHDPVMAALVALPGAANPVIDSGAAAARLLDGQPAGGWSAVDDVRVRWELLAVVAVRICAQARAGGLVRTAAQIPAGDRWRPWMWVEVSLPQGY